MAGNGERYRGAASLSATSTIPIDRGSGPCDRQNNAGIELLRKGVSNVARGMEAAARGNS